MEIKRIEEFIADSDKKANKYYDEYQSTGTGRTYKTACKYEDLATIGRMALAYQKKSDDGYLKRQNNVKALISNLTEETYTKDQVAKLLREVARW